MKIGIDIQALAGRLTGVGYYTLGLLKGLAALSPSDQIYPFYFSYHGNVELPSLVYKKLFPRGRKIPGRLLSASWKWLGIPPLNWLVPGMDLYHFTNFVARPVRRKPVITTIYDLSFREYPEYTEPKNLKYLNHFLPPTLERSDRIIVISKFTRTELLEYYSVPENKIRVIYGGVNEEFRRKITADELMRLKYRYRLPEKYILTVGTWEPRKNLAGLLRAWQILKRRSILSDYKLVLVGGKGWLYQDLERHFSGRGIPGVQVLGYVGRGDLPAIYRGAKLFVFPSFYEGQGFPPLEAQAEGVPVAASRIPALEEILGGGASYFDPRAPEEIASVLEEVLNNVELQERLKTVGLENSLRFSWEEAARRTLDLYREACGG